MIVSLNNISHSLQDETLFKNIAISFLPSAIILISGGSSLGRTLLSRVIAGIQKPTEGSCDFINLYFNTSKLRSNLFQAQKLHVDIHRKYGDCLYINNKLSLKSDITVLENIKFYSSIYNSNLVLDAAIEYFNLSSILNKKCSSISKAEKVKIIFSKLLFSNTKVWVLSEIEDLISMHNLEKEGSGANLSLIIQNLIITKANNGGIIFISSNKQLYHNAINSDTSCILKLKPTYTIELK